MTKLTKSLKADLPAIAELLRSKGKGKDTILAHINPREAALLKRHGGSGEINPDTGLPMFDDGIDLGGDMPVYSDGVEQTPAQVAAANPNLYAGGDSMAKGNYTAFGLPQELRGKDMDVVNEYYANRPYQAQGLSADGTPSGLGDYSLSSGVPTVGLGQIGTPGGTGQGLADTGVSPLYTNTTGAQLAALPYDPSLGPTSREALQQAQTSGPSQDTLTKLANSLGGVNATTLMKALGLGGLGLLGARNARQGGADVQAAKQEQQAIASPYQAQGQEMIGAAQRGELTPQSQQAYQAAMAQANQAMAGRGGVGQAQMQQQMANLYNQLLQNQYTYGLQVAQIGDNIAIGAIKSGLQQDRALQQTTLNFYAQLAAVASGNVIGGTKPGVA